MRSRRGSGNPAVNLSPARTETSVVTRQPLVSGAVQVSRRL